jgi:hypothetical protein
VPSPFAGQARARLEAVETGVRHEERSVHIDTVSVPLDLLPAPLGRLDARRDGGEWFVFNRRGLRKALGLCGWRDGVRGRSAAVLAG